MDKPNPVNVNLKDKVQFDVQNPIIRSLATQFSNNEKAIFEQIKKAPSTTDVTISKRLKSLKNLRTKIIMTTMMMEMVTFLIYQLRLRLYQKIMNSIVNLILMMKN